MIRREFIRKTGSALALAATSGPILGSAATYSNQPKHSGSTSKRFEISLSQWSFHRAIFGDSRNDYNWFLKTLQSDPDQVLQGTMAPEAIVDKAVALKVSYVDLVNLLFFGKVKDAAWLKAFKKHADNHGVGVICVMCDECGTIGSRDKTTRTKAIDLHLPWMDAAALLGGTQLRVNAYGDGSYLEQLENCSETLSILANEAQQRGLELLVENHGHPSSTGAWLAMLMQHCNHPNLGVFTDFDNFFMGGWNHQPQRRYDRIQGLEDLAPYTRGISAKSYDFNPDGTETNISYERCLNLLLANGFSGFVSAEYEGEHLPEQEGTHRTIELLRRYQ